MDPWKEIARNEQQQFLEIFGSTDWDVYRPQERKLLYDKVGMVIFGPPSTVYDDKQEAHIKKVTDVIIREDIHDSPGGTLMSIVILVVKPAEDHYYCHPVFRVPKYSGSSNKHNAFIDCIGRVYKSWNDFLENNKLPQSEICYPVDGVYRQDVYGQVVLKFGRSESSVLLEVADGARNLLAFASLGVATAALAVPITAPLVAIASVGTAVCGIYNAARVTQDLVDRNKHGQSISFYESLGSAITIVTAFTGVASSFKCVQLSGSLKKSVTLGVAGRAAGAVTISNTQPEMSRDVRGKAMLHRDVSSYVLLFGHVAADATYVVDLINSDEKNNILCLKSIVLTKNNSGETLRYLEFVGFACGKLGDILSMGIFDCSCKFKLSFPCSVEMFRNIKDYVSGCINRNLSVTRFKGKAQNIKVVIDFFYKHDITWAIEACKTILSEMECEKGQAFLGIMAGFYYFLRKVINMVQSGEDVSFPGLNFTPNDIVLVIKMCIARGSNFYEKFTKLCKDYILPNLLNFLLIGSVCLLRKCIHPPNTRDLPSLSDNEIFKAAGDLAEVPLDSNNAKITYAKSEIFVIITDPNIKVKVVQIVQDKECEITASVLQ